MKTSKVFTAGLIVFIAGCASVGGAALVSDALECLVADVFVLPPKLQGNTFLGMEEVSVLP
jgi:hypothetical protein